MMVPICPSLHFFSTILQLISCLLILKVELIPCVIVILFHSLFNLIVSAILLNKLIVVSIFVFKNHFGLCPFFS